VSKAPSLHSRFAWTFAGNAFNAFSQWLVLSIIAKLGSAEMLGQYALAVAIAAPAAMLSHLNLRAVVVTDIEGRHAPGEYMSVRLWTTGLGLAAIVAIGLASEQAPAVFLIGVALAAEAISDLYYAFLQRRERMERIAASMILRGLFSAAGVGLALWLTENLVAAVAAFAAVRVATLLVFDCATQRAAPLRLHGHGDVLKSALPLGLVLMLGSLNTNLPRYAIEWSEGAKALGGFTAAASFLAVGNTMIHALGQAATPRLARAAISGDRAGFRRLSVQLAAMGALLGVAGVVAALALGRIVLHVLYRPEYVAYRDLLVALMGAAVFQYVAIALGYALTSARLFAVQIPLLAAVSASVAITAFLLVPRLGLPGAALSLAVGGCVQAAGATALLRRMEKTA
jgi:O-antigen/teichoic acid export membrane protein